MALYIVETDGSLNPLDPVGGYFGPLLLEVPVSWIAFEEVSDGVFDVVPEIEFPNCRHMRRPDWLCDGVRPSRAMPRGFRHRLLPVPSTVGAEPPGLIDTLLECWDSDPTNAVRSSAQYLSNDGEPARCIWAFITTATSHATSSDVRSWSDADFIFSFSTRYWASNGTDWILATGPDEWAGEFALSGGPLPSLALAREGTGPNPPKARSVVIRDDYELVCSELHTVLPVVIPPNATGATRLQFPPDGVVKTEFEIVEESYEIGGTFGQTVASFQQASPIRTTAYCFWSPSPSEFYRWNFVVEGGLPFASNVLMQNGQVVRLEWEQRSGLSTVRWYVDDVLLVTFSNVGRWVRCGNAVTFNAFLNTLVRSDCVVSQTG